jgi:type II secretory pathway component GspD/PulD (secretin)
MNRLIALLSLCLLALPALATDESAARAQTAPGVTIDSKGADVRNVLHDLFTQQGKNYVLEPNIRFVLYLSLKDVEFEEALHLVCKLSNLEFKIQNGIYFVSQKKAQPKPEPPKQDPPKQEAPAAQPPAQQPKPAAPAPKTEAPKGQLPQSVLQKRVTTRFDKIDIRTLFQEFGKQTNVKIEIDKNVPIYRIDAYLLNTSLKYALDTVTGAAGLQYRFTDNQSILIFDPKA